jgi:hypothetical protein
MANKALATRQKMMLRAQPAQQTIPARAPRNPFAALAKARVAGPHAKPAASARQAAKRQLSQAPLVPDDD